jgi:hypothetical protein
MNDDDARSGRPSTVEVKEQIDQRIRNSRRIRIDEMHLK